MNQQERYNQKIYYAKLLNSPRAYNRLRAKSVDSSVDGAPDTLAHSSMLRNELLSRFPFYQYVLTYNPSARDQYLLRMPVGNANVYTGLGGTIVLDPNSATHQHIATDLTYITSETIEDWIVSDNDESLDAIDQFVLESLQSEILQKILNAKVSSGDRFDGLLETSVDTTTVDKTGAVPSYSQLLAELVESVTNTATQNDVVISPINRVVTIADGNIGNRLVLDPASELEWTDSTHYQHATGSKVLVEALASNGISGQCGFALFDSNQIAFGVGEVKVQSDYNVETDTYTFVGSSQVGWHNLNSTSNPLALYTGAYV